MAKQVIARALLQSDKNFPIDCETLDALQSNTAAVQVLGNIVGDKAILYGCGLESNGTRRGAGYIFLRTGDYPEGEVVYWEGGNISGGMYLHQESVAVTAQGYDFPQAYTERSLRPGIGAEHYSWDDFKQYKTPGQLEQDVSIINTAVAKLAPLPLGIVQIWAGTLGKLPAGYALCDGSSLQISEYPELYAILGMTHGGVPNNSFQLPDLRSRFVVGYSSADADYNAIGVKGGKKAHILTASELPSHAHPVKDYYYIENDKSITKLIDGKESLGDSYTGSAGTDRDNNTLLYKTHDTELAGGGAAHENRPPYYTLAYIMRLK